MDSLCEFPGGGENEMKKFQDGFTLVELLVVIGILAILTAVVLVAVNPARQLAQARNTERQAEINSILAAITAFDADPDNLAALPPIQDCGLGAVEIFADNTAVAPQVDLSVLVPVYIAALPEDPADPSALGDTGYEICESATDNRYTVSAPDTEPPATAPYTITR
jgi:prepilin-type N-terminal cleavage/methylation domain-containing protein